MKLSDLRGGVEWTRADIEQCEAEYATHWINGKCFRRDESTGKYIYDEIATNEEAKRKRESQQYRDDLWFALRSRVLTEAEMVDVERADYHLLVRDCEVYGRHEVEKRFNEGLLCQFRIRRAAELLK